MINRIYWMLRGRYAVMRNIWQHPLNYGSRFRAIGDYFLWNIAKIAMRSEHVVSVGGKFDIILGRKENYGSAVYSNSIPDYEEMMLLAHFLRDGDQFIDVGANVGIYSIWVTTITGATSVAFEANPETYGKLQRNIRLNQLEPKIFTHNCAVGEKRGSVNITTSKGGLDHIVADGVENKQTALIEMVALDHQEIALNPAAIKMDVEGYEMNALIGASNLLGNPNLKVLVIELQDWTLQRFGTSKAEVVSLLQSHGFHQSAYDPETRCISERSDLVSLNEIFVRDAEAVATRLRDAPKVNLSFARRSI